MIPSILLYLLNSALCLTIFIVCYRVLFHLHLPHNWNRWLLIGGLIGSFLLPMFSISIEIPFEVSHDWEPLNQSVSQFSATLEEPRIADMAIETMKPLETEEKSGWINFWEIGFLTYLVIGLWFAFRFITGLSNIFKRIRNSIGEKRKTYFLLKQMNGGPPTSFFSFILIDDSFDELEPTAQEFVITHEQIHIEEKHSWDILAIELIQVIQWFNPFVPFYKKTIQEIHEYMADDRTTQVYNKYEYSRLLVSLTANTSTLPLVNGFAKSLISSRIEMLMNPSDPSRGRKYWILPLSLILVGIFSCNFSFEPQSIKNASKIATDSSHYEEGENLKQLPAIKPVDAKIMAGFGMQIDSITKIRKMNTGVDFDAAAGTPVYATADGTVNLSESEMMGYTHQVILEHDLGEKNGRRFKTRYSRLQSVWVKDGQLVKRGDVVGLSGKDLSKGAHLHYEVMEYQRAKGEFVNVDPILYMPEDIDPQPHARLREARDTDNEQLEGSSNLIGEKLKHIPAIKPVNAKVTVRFGMRMHPIMKSRRMHTGVDFIVPIGTPVRATADGIVKIVGTQKGGYGIQIELAHDSGKGEIRFETKYAHLLSVEVTKGQFVKQGDVIGYSGNSGLSKGPHLHYEVIDKSRKVNPEIYFPQDSLPNEDQNSKEEKRFLTDRDEMSMD